MVEQSIQKHNSYYEFLKKQDNNKLWRELTSLSNSNMFVSWEERNEKVSIIYSILKQRWIDIELWLWENWFFIFKWIINNTKEKVFDLIQA